MRNVHTHSHLGVIYIFLLHARAVVFMARRAVGCGAAARGVGREWKGREAELNRREGEGAKVRGNISAMKEKDGYGQVEVRAVFKETA